VNEQKGILSQLLPPIVVAVTVAEPKPELMCEYGLAFCTSVPRYTILVMSQLDLETLKTSEFVEPASRMKELLSWVTPKAANAGVATASKERKLAAKSIFDLAVCECRILDRYQNSFQEVSIMALYHSFAMKLLPKCPCQKNALGIEHPCRRIQANLNRFNAYLIKC
jgi:hypothetical protein